MTFRLKPILAKLGSRDWKSPSVVILSGSAILFLVLINIYFPLWTASSSLGTNDLLLSRGLTPLPPLKPLEDCPSNYTYFLPCQDPVIAVKFKRKKNEFRERHCPSPEARLRCLIPAPRNYRKPVYWPKSRDQIWTSNVPHTNIYKNKLNKAWMDIRNDYWIFRGFGTMFPRGINLYLERLKNYVPLTGGNVRTALDIGCGVGSFGAALFDFDVLTMSIAPKDFNKGQTEFVLERGIPALISLLATQRLTFPSRAFDLIQCARCNVDFLLDDGVYLLEVDRLLRPKGYFVLGGPPVNWNASESSWLNLTALTQRICWSLVAIDGNVAIWQKPVDHKCILRRTPGTEPPLCQASDDPDNSWNRRLQPCLARMPNLKEQAAWPARLTAPPMRMPQFPVNEKQGGKGKGKGSGGEKNDPGDSASNSDGSSYSDEMEDDAGDDVSLDDDGRRRRLLGKGEGNRVAVRPSLFAERSAEVLGDTPKRNLASSDGKLESMKPLGPVSEVDVTSFNKDTRRWRRRVKYLKSMVIRSIKRGHLRNILDMNAGFGGFAASLVSYPVWVMNVVPITEPNTLPVIYDRGLIGVTHDWCEAFSTYPRTYDLIHAVNVRGFIIGPKRCDPVDVFIELDRILRPGGKVIFRDGAKALAKVMKVSKAVGWTVELMLTEEGVDGKELLLVGDKPLHK